LKRDLASRLAAYGGVSNDLQPPGGKLCFARPARQRSLQPGGTRWHTVWTGTAAGGRFFGGMGFGRTGGGGVASPVSCSHNAQ